MKNKVEKFLGCCLGATMATVIAVYCPVLVLAALCIVVTVTVKETV